MPNTGISGLDFLSQIGTVEQIRELARQELSYDKFPVNTHIHLPPNFSAFQSVEQAINLASQQGVKVIGAGNYYDFTIYRKFSALAQQKKIFPLYSTEIIAIEEDLQQRDIKVNDPDNPGKYYICGKGITKFEYLAERAKELLNIIRRNDTERMHLMAEKITGHFKNNGVDTGLDAETIISRVVTRYNCDRQTVVLQERHLAQAFQEAFFLRVNFKDRKKKLDNIFGSESKSKPDDSVSIQNEIRSNLLKAGKICFVPETFINLAQAKELILQLGGIPCYPVLADGAKQRCEYEYPLDNLINNLKNNNYYMAEFIPVRNHPVVLAEYVHTIRREGIAVVAGTEHNSLDLIPIEPLCINGQPIPDDLKKIFREGACVLAAHQFLQAHNKCGFVDSSGVANPDYKNSEDRIGAFKKIGYTVLSKYFNLVEGRNE
ncbi:MAG: hypothetical protein WCE45_02635 [Sedimentisphaerales bacterium]